MSFRGNCWRPCDMNIAEHNSIDYTKHCSVGDVVQLYKSTASLQKFP